MEGLIPIASERVLIKCNETKLMILETIHLFMFHSFDLLRGRNSNFERQIIYPSKHMDGGTNSHR